MPATMIRNLKAKMNHISLKLLSVESFRFASQANMEKEYVWMEIWQQPNSQDHQSVFAIYYGKTQAFMIWMDSFLNAILWLNHHKSISITSWSTTTKEK